MAHEVIMPALGMAQDTGKLTSWMKQPGDAVAKGDVLFEVETDKSVAEVEAQHAGFLTDVTAADGDDVPVGQVIARISETAEDSAGNGASADAREGAGNGADAGERAPAGAPQEPAEAAPQAKAAPEPAPSAGASAPSSAEPSSSPAPAPAQEGRILASPKARRLAADEGLDLARLAQAGHPQPYHVADLEVLRTLPAGRNSEPDTAAHEAPTGTRGGPESTPGIMAPQTLACQVAARVPRAGVADFLDWMERDGGVVLPPAHLFASFAARALRAATGTDGPLTVALVPLTGTPVRFADPDRCRLSALRETQAEPDLMLRDLTASRLTGLRGTAPDIPTLTIAEAGADYVLTLDATEAALSEDRAIALVTDLADRLATPLLSVL